MQVAGLVCTFLLLSTAIAIPAATVCLLADLYDAYATKASASAWFEDNQLLSAVLDAAQAYAPSLSRNVAAHLLFVQQHAHHWLEHVHHWLDDIPLEPLLPALNAGKAFAALFLEKMQMDSVFAVLMGGFAVSAVWHEVGAYLKALLWLFDITCEYCHHQHTDYHQHVSMIKSIIIGCPGHASLHCVP